MRVIVKSVKSLVSQSIFQTRTHHNNVGPTKIPMVSSESIFPKELTDQDIAKFVRDLNNRPRKVLVWKTPSEVFFGKKLHLI
ncbi:transposase [Lactiplantibacillus plantarum]|nr:transposase [Lactiplantibacillus plantarum]MCG0619445.1 transposase [Lactiplantibacillus plantarum]MCG0780362.1 transposase [Lactiplantibacillus plantarum]MCG0807889.1 transposase [Lactiplantibacillus plantarum]MCG0832889.1 transposase [Lactiplantibacillus plantarum]